MTGVPGIDFLEDRAEQALADHATMARPCSDCAFDTATSAASNPVTARLAADCVAARHPFWCHKVKCELGLPTHLCAGWASRVRVDDASSTAEPEAA